MSRKIFVLVATAILLTSLGVGYWWFFLKTAEPTRYIISGVPAYTFFNVGFNTGVDEHGRRLNASSTKAVLDMVFDYWSGVKGFLTEYPTSIEYPNAVYLFSDLARFARTRGFEAEIHQAEDIGDLRRFINPEARTPVIVAQKPSLTYPGTTAPFRLVIGLDDRAQRVVTHDFIFGNNYEISYSDFAKLWQDIRPGFERHFLVIRPHNWRSRAGEIATLPYEHYSPRTQAMDQKFLNEKVFFLQERARAGVRAEELIDAHGQVLLYEENFKHFPNWWQLLVYSFAADAHLKIGDTSKAHELAEKIKIVNENLDNEHPGWEWRWPYGSQSAIAFKLVGDIYVTTGKRQEALTYYRKAWEIRGQLDRETQALLVSKIGALSQ